MPRRMTAAQRVNSPWRWRSSFRGKRIRSPASCSPEDQKVAPGGARCAPPAAGLSELLELQHELIGFAADVRIKHLGGVRIVLVGKQVTLAFELEAGGLDFLDHRRFV